MEYIKWFFDNCCCYSGYVLKKKKKKILNEEQIREKALVMLQKWTIDMYANNRFLYKIPQKQINDQLDLFIKEVRIDNIYL